MNRRLSLTLEPPDVLALEPFTRSGAEREALLRLAATDLIGSTLATDAAVLRALIRVGAAAVRDQVLAEGYAEMADEYRANDAERQAMRERRTARDARRG